ncbi:Sensor histidine kinase YpdA [compost metagenome]
MQARNSLEAMLQQSSSFLNYKTNSVRKVIDVIVLHDTIRTLVNKPMMEYQQNIGNWLLDEYFFNQLIFNVQTNPDIQNIGLYMRDGMAALQSTNQFMLLESPQSQPWLKRINEEDSPFLWLPPGMVDNQQKKTVTLIRKINNPLETGSYSGLLRAEMPISVLEQILDQSLFTPSSSALLFNSHQEFIAGSNRNRIDHPSMIFDALKTQLNTDIQQVDTVMLNGEKTLLASISVDNTDWKFVLVVPHKDIAAIWKKALNQLLLTFLAVALLTLPMAYYVSSSGTLRIRKLSKMMRKVGVDELKVVLDPVNNDEIGDLTKSFNQMLTRIEDLGIDKYQLGLEVKSMELRALQAQINPHFLYNTLDMVNWLSMKYNADDIRTLITSLSDFYKISLSNGEDIISIRSEIEHIRAYVLIQNMRFRNLISLEIDIPEEVLNCLTPKLVLQPLVENAILHGITEKKSPSGTIRIHGYRENSGIWLVVEDDGVGMDKETMQSIMNGTLERQNGGYGMKNIHHRLEIMFGPTYGLIVEGKAGVGTKVTLRLPLLEN